MLYFLDASYSKDDDSSMLQYFGPGDGPRYCGSEKIEDEFGGMLRFTKGRVLDFIYIKPGVMACKPKVKNIIDQEVDDGIQFLSIIIGGDEFFIINVTNVIDALDHDNSIIKCLPDGRIMKIDPCVICEKSIPECLFFKIPQNSCRALFGTEKLKRIVEAYGFDGLRFIPLPFCI